MDTVLAGHGLMKEHGSTTALPAGGRRPENAGTGDGPHLSRTTPEA
ncbi:hypothetical protein [Streptomyces sp. NEAU-NA10]